MSRLGQPSQARIAEKLTILNDRGIGLLTRLYELKKSLSKPDTRPKVLTEKSLESTIKSIDKKFNPTSCSASNLGSALNSTIRADVIKGMHQSYFTFVDIMEFNDHVRELLVFIDANQIHFDISLNFDLTKRYLDLITAYISMMILLSRVDERKIIIGLYNVAYEIQHSTSETNFHRLGQLMLDFDPPIKKINEDFIPHVKTLTFALLSLKALYERRDLTANQWRSSQYLSIISEPSKLMEPARSETIPCEYLSMDIMQRWVVLGFLIIHQQLGDNNTNDLWKRALGGGWVIKLWRDEVLNVHPYIEKYFERVRGYEKRLKEVRDIHHNKACIESTQLHKERRKFLRMTLKEMNLLFTDQPGLLGPKALLAFMALSHARDEIIWLLRHADNIPHKSKIKVNNEDLNDRQLPELLFYVEELRGIIKKYSQVLQRYFIQYLNGHDYQELNDIVTSCDSLSSDDSTILSHTLKTIQELNVTQLDDSNQIDFMGLRMDWVRLQANCSSSKSQLSLKDNRGLAKLMNTITFHAKMVDYLDEILNETSDFSLYCFYTSILEQQFRQCMEFPAQHRYSVVFPLLCSHFVTATHDLCPEEKLNIGQTSVQYCNWFLREMADEVNQVITAICEEQTRLSDKCLPKHCIEKLLYEGRKGQDQQTGRKKNQRVAEFRMPGEESKRRCREDFGRLDKLQMALTELSYALNHTPIIHVWGHGFVPREFFIHNLEGRFNKALPGMLMHNPTNDEIAKPSEVLSGLRSMMDVLQSLESYINIDVSRIFNTVLLQQTQRVDGLVGEKTITTIYTSWYLETLLRHVSTGHIVYSPLQKAFVSLSTEEKLSFSAEEYSDVKELRALCELIGPYGVRFLGEQLMSRVTAQVQELKSIVASNKDILNELRTSFDKPDRMSELTRQLQNTDSVIQRLTIIGVLLSFRKMIQEVLYNNMVDHAPFLMSSIKDFSDNIPISPESTYINEMAASAGFDCAVDPLLVAAIRNMKPLPHEDEYKLSCLLMVFIAVTIPKKSSSLFSAYDANLEGHVNNLHCIGRAINQLAQAMFLLHSKTGQSDVEDRLKEFLALASSSLLRLGQENEREAVRSRESVYLLLHIIVNESNQVLSMDLLESCFPYALLRHAYSAVINNSVNTSSKKAA